MTTTHCPACGARLQKLSTLETTLREHFTFNPQSTQWMSRTAVLDVLHQHGIPNTQQVPMAVDRVLIRDFGLIKSIRNNQRGYQGIAHPADTIPA